ncbi:HAMP domain-containing histidine kinase [Protaetiibacter sp. SSC-01]|uniref:sensor histidine kinase n=1 Tax=Protaetiibacter sp. SSC-01 TaxID=2759943 RepID=UPI0016571259|nr:HAMP domain-containing sensor histidine kinase [Protaetiibacter sp. SSC-01]QNO37177.1 HAMP domain-containing histidine kinase [Protaetiibacter sp. SSC-01]
MTEASAPHPSRAPWSIRSRVAIGVVALVALLGIFIGTVSVLALRQNLTQRLDAQVHDIMRAVSSGSPATLPGGGDNLRGGVVLAVALPSGAAQGYIYTGPGMQAALTEQQIAQVLDARSGVISTVGISGLGTFRVEARHGENGSYAVGLSTAEVDQTAWTLAGILALVTAGALLLAGLGAVALTRVALRPLGRVSDTATRVTELQLASGDAAIPERVPAAEADPRTEVGQVGAALNAMLGHVEEALVARQRSEEKVRRFVADASHELRTPLASIRGYAELTRRIDSELPDDAIRSLDRIESESVRMTALVEDLLELARLDEGRSLEHSEVELVRLVTDAVGDAYVAAPDHEWEVVAPEPPLAVEGDAARLQQVVVNLLANAHRHTPAGTAVTVTLARDGEDAVLTVADDGPGIDPELQPVLFERFARGDSSRTRATGSTGLGLAIVAAVVDAHGGGIRVDSVPGDTRFTVRLPLRAPRPEAGDLAD